MKARFRKTLAVQNHRRPVGASDALLIDEAHEGEDPQRNWTVGQTMGLSLVKRLVSESWVESSALAFYLPMRRLISSHGSSPVKSRAPTSCRNANGSPTAGEKLRREVARAAWRACAEYSERQRQRWIFRTLACLPWKCGHRFVGIGVEAAPCGCHHC